MSVLRELPRNEVLPGLKLKRVIGGKIVIVHKGEQLEIQVAQFLSGWQVCLAFYDPKGTFHVYREEALVKSEVPR